MLDEIKNEISKSLKITNSKEITPYKCLEVFIISCITKIRRNAKGTITFTDLTII